MALSQDETEADQEFLELQLSLGFPNLSEEERNLVAACHWAARSVILGQGTLKSVGLDEVERVKLGLQLRLSEIDYLKTRYKLEQYGIRAKLSAFQEQLLSDFVIVEVGSE